MATLEERRKADRKRSKRYRNIKQSEGGKLVQVMLFPATKKVLENEKKRTGEPYVSIINRAIMDLKDRSIDRE
jgi:hypothetical protein